MDLARDDLRAFRNTRIYLTGGTGFVGTWILASIVHANARLDLNISVDVPSRNPAAFCRREPELSGSDGVHLIHGDVRTGLAYEGTYDAVIHAATPIAARLTPSEAFDTIVAGDRATLELAARSGNIPFLYMSSGAIYGRQPPDLYALDEDFPGAPDPLSPAMAYHHGKRTGELICALAASEKRVTPKIARLFAFVGPFLPLDRHFAVGNFIRDVLRSAPIVVNGDGTAIRSYLYASDMTVWLWAILARGPSGRPYNVGSEAAIPIETLARAVSELREALSTVEVRGIRAASEKSPERYVPNTSRARNELGVSETVGLSSALRRTIAWHRSRRCRAAFDSHMS